MDYAKDIQPVTVLKTKSAELIRIARSTGQPVVITQNGKPTAVIQDVESFQRQRKALFLLKALVQGEQDFREGRSLPHSRAGARLKRKLKELEKLA